jgi:excisionase family DNA binding protein
MSDKSNNSESERLTFTVVEAARLLGISRGLAYELVRRREIPVIRMGRRLLIPKAALLKMLQETKANSLDQQ